MKDIVLAICMLAAGGFGWGVCSRLDAFVLRSRRQREARRERSRRS